jgi:hypothetical protein
MAKRASVGRIRELVNQSVQEFLVSANIIPATDGGATLGSSEKGFANCYLNDLHLKNERGDWTIVEEEEYLSIRNNKTGKLYKFVLEEVVQEDE